MGAFGRPFAFLACMEMRCIKFPLNGNEQAGRGNQQPFTAKDARDAKEKLTIDPARMRTIPAGPASRKFLWAALSCG